MPDNKEETKWELADEETRDLFIDKAADLLKDTYICTRVWSAWGYGTMGQDDFVESYSEDDRVFEVAEELFEFTTARHADKELIGIIEGALAISDLWTYPESECPGNPTEAQALSIMKSKFEQLLDEYKKGQ